VSLQKLSYAELRVTDVDKELEFLTGVVGLEVKSREGDVVYLSCGYDDYVDVVLHPSGTGVANFSIQVDGYDDLDRYADRLHQEGISTSRASERIPGIAHSLIFQLPSGHPMELVTLSDFTQTHLHPALSSQNHSISGVNPIDIDHITLRTPEVKPLAEFLRNVLDFRISEAFSPAPDVWGAAWTRVGEYHHDVAMMTASAPGETLDHLCFTMLSIDHIKAALDSFAQSGYLTETGPGRHGVGGNLYSYIWGPGGNRYEFTAEMPRMINPLAPPRIWTDQLAVFSSWGALPPESFSHGS
jgi:catechol 2,3-dioxygenase